MTAATPAATTSSGPSWLSAAQDLGTVGMDAYSLYNSGQQQGQANTIYQQSNPFGGYRPQYGQMLLNLIQNPSSVTSQPGYQFMMNQGIQAIDRSAAGPNGSGLGSGGEMTDLEQYGQGLADQFYQQQVGTLAQLAGANINPANPAQAFSAEQSAAQGTGSSIQTALNGISTAGKAYSDLSSLFSSFSSAGGVAAAASGALADGAVTGALGTVASQVAPMAGSMEAANSAALASQMAAEGETGAAAASGSGAAAGGSSATTAAAGGGMAGGAAAVGGALLPLALAALVPYNSGFSVNEVQGMMQQIQQATAANGGPLNAGSGISDGSVSNPQLASAYQDLITLLGDNPEEFSKSGGTGYFLPLLKSLGYGNLLAGPGSTGPAVSPGGTGTVFGRSRGRISSV